MSNYSFSSEMSSQLLMFLEYSKTPQSLRIWNYSCHMSNCPPHSTWEAVSTHVFLVVQNSSILSSLDMSATVKAYLGTEGTF